MNKQIVGLPVSIKGDQIEPFSREKNNDEEITPEKLLSKNGFKMKCSLISRVIMMICCQSSSSRRGHSEFTEKGLENPGSCRGSVSPHDFRN